MPAISMFYGIIVYMYFFDTKKHKQPHVHAEFAEHSVIVSIEDGEVLAGNFPSKKMKMLQAWIAIHEDELMADWKLAVEGQEVFKIDPLK